MLDTNYPPLGLRGATLVCGTLLALAPRTAAQMHAPDPPRAGASEIGDAYFPGMGDGGYDVEHYDLELHVDMETDVLVAEAKIRARALHALSAFNLDLHGLKVASVEVDGERAAFRHEELELTITPAVALAENAEFEVHITYGGIPESAPDPSHLFRGGSGWRRMKSGVYITSQCAGAPSWFPCNDHPRDKALFRIAVTVARPWVVAANGLLTEESDLGDSRRYVFEMNQPMATYLATMNIAEFEVRVEEGPHGMPMRTYYPKDMSEGELQAFARQGEMIEFFETIFGPYPFESVGAIIANENLGGALETQSTPVYGRGMPEAVVAHELAHQWFGDSVSTRDWRDLWLNEGFATYAATLWKEHTSGLETSDTTMAKSYGRLRKNRIGPPAYPGVRRLFGPEAYARGAWVLHCLRLEVDEEAFFEILTSWTEKNRYADASTDEFIAHCEEVSGRDLGDLFEGALFAPVIPKHPLYEDI